MTLYLDMDGVLADFFAAFAEKHGKTHWKLIQNKEKAIASLRYTDFFGTLPVFPSAEKLINFAKEYGDWGICSSPLTGDRDNSAFWKRVWLERNNFMPEVNKLIFTGMKEKYAVDPLDGTPNILVDDKPSNIDKWTKKGGIGILYQADQDNIDTLIEKLNEVFS
jgi:hypothetical protein